MIIKTMSDLMRSVSLDQPLNVINEVISPPTEEDVEVSLETPKFLLSYTEEDDRYNRSNPFLISPDTDWIDDLYSTLYPLPGSKRHKDTFRNIITNLSLRRTKVAIQLHKSKYKDTYLPSYFLPSKVTEICSKLENKGYIELNRGYKIEGQKGVATTMEPTESLLSLIPPDMSYEIMEQGLVIPKEFSYKTFPQSAIETRELLSEYNKTVEPENMLYATHKGGFELNGRFTGSSVVIMRKEDRKDILIDGEPTVELDISNCLPFLLYASELEDELPGDLAVLKIEDLLSNNTYKGTDTSRKDAYKIEGIPRKLAKTCFMVAINTPSRTKARSTIQSEINSQYSDLPYNASYILDQIEIAHPELVDEYLYKGLGHRLMYLEAQCMATFMRSMLDKGIKFYPIYDSVRVPISKKAIAEEELKKAFTIHGIEPVIHEE